MPSLVLTGLTGNPVGVELTGNKEMKLTANDRSEMYNWVQKLTLLIWLVL